jgi:elongation factor Ts
MAKITAAQVKELRDATGISMLKCKQSLEEANGDLEKAREILRKLGEADAAKRSEKEAGEGVIAVKAEGGKAVILQLLCETDFVAKGENFTNLAAELAEDALAGKDLKTESEAKIQEAIQKNGENIKIGEVEILEGEKVASYLHSNGKIGVLVSFSGDEEIGKDIAMQIAAMNPSVLSPDEVNEDEVAKEAEIQKEILAKEGKPAEMIEKIMEGKLKKFRDSQSLVKQAFVKDSSKTVEAFLTENNAKVEKFVRLAI